MLQARNEPAEAGGIQGNGMPQAMHNGRLEIGVLRPYIKIHNKTGRELGVFANVQGREVQIARNAVLRKDEWKFYDTALVEAAKLRLTAVADLQRRGLVFNLPNGWGSTVLEYEEMGEMNDAQISMDGLTVGKNDRLEFTIKYLPLPIFHKDFQINARVLASSRTTGAALDTLQVTEATFKVAELMEETLVNGASTYTFGGGIIYGYTDFPSRITGSLTDKWDDMVDNSNGTIGEQILTDVLAMITATKAKLHFGPYVLYIPKNYEETLGKDYATGYPKSIRTRLMEIDGLDDIVVLDKLADDAVLLVQTTPNVVRMVQGMPLTNVQWKSSGDFVHHFKVMTINVPQLRADANGNTGIAHYSG